MRTYENAPATKLLATHCACCGRPLVDALSVETGVGPDCRKKHGYDRPDVEPDAAGLVAAGLVAALGTIGAGCDAPALPEGASAPWRDGDTRKVANVLVYHIAAEQIGEQVNRYTNAVRALGFRKLADRIAQRLAPIRIELEGNELVVTAPFSEQSVVAFRRVPGRRWDPQNKANRFPCEAKRSLFEALRAAYPGATAIGPKGLFTIDP